MDTNEKKLKDHYHNPRNYGTLEKPDFAIQEYNPSCGDCISFEGKIENGQIVNLRFTAQGCIISKATASLLTELCIGKTLTFVASLTSNAILNLIGINLGPLRLKCALLPLQALQKGIQPLLTKE